MAIDPATLATIVSQSLKVITDEEKRTRLILGIVIFVVLFLMIIIVPIYLLTHPIETIKMIVKGDSDISSIEQLKTDYTVGEYGTLNFIGKFPFPLQSSSSYVITSEYGKRIHPITKQESFHTGIDIVTVHHDSIIAIEKGKVSWAGVQSGYGNCIEIQHNIDGEIFYSFYAHLSQIKVQTGQEVSQGQIIALEGGDPESDPNPRNKHRTSSTF